MAAAAPACPGDEVVAADKETTAAAPRLPRAAPDPSFPLAPP